jgi:hypothetical protein
MLEILIRYAAHPAVLGCSAALIFYIVDSHRHRFSARPRWLRFPARWVCGCWSVWRLTRTRDCNRQATSQPT